jgi:glycosyltransferase involved in cell wall biosynthesis
MDESMRDLVEAALFDPLSLPPPAGRRGHMLFAYWLIKTLKPKVFVELGAHTGNSYFSFCQAVKEMGLKTQCYAVDSRVGDEHAELCDKSVCEDVSVFNREHYSEFSALLRMRLEDALLLFESGSIDLLHIDELHTCEAVRHEFEVWRPTLKQGALVLLHNTRVREHECGVWKLWEELKHIYPDHFEFSHSNGLGIFRVSTTSMGDLFQEQVTLLGGKNRLANYFACNRAGNSAKIELPDRDKKLADRDRQVVDRDLQNSLLSADLSVLESSLSWRMTAPFRNAGMLFASLRIAWANAFAYALRNGPFQTVLHAINLIRRHGLEALKPMAPLAFDHKRNNYAEWIDRFDTIDDSVRTKIKSKIAEMPVHPLISVVMPTYNSNPVWLREAIDSVLHQLYPHWELCIADDASTDSTTRPILEDYARRDGRIKVVYREQNGHISSASNSALAISRGAWIALLDHDDVLREHALYWVAQTIADNPESALIYSDEDMLDRNGNRHAPYFKPDWNLDLFYSHNLITHLGVYRKDLVDAIGGFRAGYEGAQDYDLALRIIAGITPSSIVHIPRILYHWRVHLDSTAHTEDAKPYAMRAGERALNDHIKQIRLKGRAEYLPDSASYRLHYDLPFPLPLVSIIIPVRNQYAVFRSCIKSILKTIYQHYEIIIVDNGSDDLRLLEYLRNLALKPNVRILRDDSPFNYSALNNRAVSVARGQYILLLNNDVEIINKDWLHEMVAVASQDGVGAVGAMLWYPNKTVQHGGVLLGLGVGGVAGHAYHGLGFQQRRIKGLATKRRSFSAVTGACLMVSKKIYVGVGGLEEENLSVAFNDIDFCLRVKKAGYRNVWTPYAELYHHESLSRGYEDTPEKQIRFEKEVNYMKQMWGSLLVNDPAYNPNLTLQHADFSLAWPPRVKIV